MRHRDASGKIDIDMLKAKQIERQGRDEEPVDPYEELRHVRRIQGWPEYLIAKSIQMMEATHAR